MLKLIYIVGHERSGSTFLDILLGSHPEITSVGELCTFYRYGVVAEKRCSCGEKVVDCSFWNEVKRNFLQRTGKDYFIKQIKIQDYFEGKYNLPGWLFGSIFLDKKLKRYLDVACSLYQAIADVSGKQIIVDSSKSRLRAYWISGLARRKKVDIYVIHLIRDGRGVVWSHKKLYKNLREKGVNKLGFMVKEATWFVTLRWLRVNILSDIVSRIYADNRVIYMRYEDLVQNPIQEIERILKAVGLDASPIKTMLLENSPLSPTHVIGGNGIRMSQGIVLKPDYEWKGEMPDTAKKLFWGMAGWYAKKHGYKNFYMQP